MTYDASDYSDEELTLWWSRWTDYHPTTGQWPIHRHPARVKLTAGGERAGKSKTAAMYALPRIPDTDLLWIVAKDYNLARPEFRYLVEALQPAGLVRSLSMPQGQSAPWSARLTTGGEIRTVTAADEVKLAAVAPDGIIMAEAAQQSYDIYLRLRRRLAEKRGWLFMEGTFESSEDWYADLWEAWLTGGPEGEISFSLPSWTNEAIFPLGEADPELQTMRRLNEAMYYERFGGRPTPPANVVHPEFNYSLHVGSAPYDPKFPVEVAIDPGYNGAYALLALQYYGGTVHVVDEVYERRKSVRQVIRETLSRPWAERVDPARAGVIDIAGTQHQGMESHAEIWASPRKKGGAAWTLGSRFVHITDGIERLRSFLIDPATERSRVLYNAETTKNAQLEFKRYRYGEDRDGRPQREKPIDRDNHAVKALAYWLVDRFGYAVPQRSRTATLRYGTPHAYDPGSPDRRFRRQARRRASFKFSGPRRGH